VKKIATTSLNYLVFVFMLTTSIITTFAVAETTVEPEKQIKSAFVNIEKELINLKQKNQFTGAEIKKVLNQYLLPEVDSRYFTLKSLGKYASNMSDELRAAYTKELQIQVINSYANLLSNYNNEKIVFNKSSISESGKIAQVYLNIESRNNTNTAVIKLMRVAQDNWKVFDIVIEGISLVQTKQAELSSSISKLGLEGTLNKLQKLNAKIEASQ